jgi:predicted nucleic acid-binding Zn ribbon protein
VRDNHQKAAGDSEIFQQHDGLDLVREIPVEQQGGQYAESRQQNCGKATFLKLVSAAGFQLTGSGWYQTDFRSSGKPAAAKTETQGASKPESQSEAKSDAKSDAKPETKGEAKAAPAKSPAAANSDS